jgi:hypothetical protein
LTGGLNSTKRKTPFHHQPSVGKIEREIAVTDEKIDGIVYGLYGVTKGERKKLKTNLDTIL